MATSAVNSRPPRPTSRDDFEVAILCALPIEGDAVQACLDIDWDDEEFDGPPIDKAKGDVNYYSTGVIGSYNVVVAVLPGTGTKDSTGVATALRMSFPNIKLGLVVGICGIVPGEDRILGDVVISNGVAQIDFGRETIHGFKVKNALGEALSRLPLELRSLIAKTTLLKERRKLAKYMQQYLEALQQIPELKATYPGKDHDKLFAPDYDHEDARKSCEVLGCSGTLIKRARLETASGDPTPMIHFGNFGSGSALIKSARKRDQLAAEAGLIAFEMEGAGAWEHFPCLVIKAASDYADSHKGDLFHNYAAAVAAACVKGLLQAWKPAGTNTRNYNIRILHQEYFQNCLRYLHPAALDNAFDHIESFEAVGWLQQQQNFTEWNKRSASASDPELLVIEGKPFCGKTVLMKDAVRRHREATNTITLFFFFGSKAHSNNAGSQKSVSSFTDFLKSLLGQLLRSPLGKRQLNSNATWERAPWSDLKEWGKNIKENLEPDFCTSPKIQEAIATVILDEKETLISDITAIRIFVDGISECSGAETGSSSADEDEGYKMAMDYLSSLLILLRSADIDTGVCISRRRRSRPGPEKLPIKTISLEEYTRVEVTKYIKTKLEGMKDQRHAFRLSAMLRQNSSNGFTWVKVVTGQILERQDELSLEELENLVQTIPDNHEELYKAALSNLQASTAVMLQLCLVSYRPLTVDEFWHAHAFKDLDFKCQNMAEWEKSREGLALHNFHNSIHRRSGGLMEVFAKEKAEGTHSETRVSFTHPSVATFLHGEQGLCQLLKADSLPHEQNHLLFFKTCLGVLKHCHINEKDDIKLRDYACEFWLHHARECGELAAKSRIKLPLFMRNCQKEKPTRLIQEQVRLLKKSQAKEHFLLLNQTHLAVVLATMGCTTQLKEHLATCSACKEAIEPGEDHSTASRVYMSALMNALIGQWNETAVFLLDNFPHDDIDTPFGGVTLLYKACYFASNVRSAADQEERMACVRVLLKRGAKPSAPSDYGYEYPLHVAIAMGSTQLVYELLKDATEEEKAKMFTAKRRMHGMTALHYAVVVPRPLYQRRQVLETLLDLAPTGLRLAYVEDDNGKSPVALAEGIEDDIAEEMGGMLDSLEL